MVNTYIFEVLTTLPSDELEAFRLFLESPYFNRGHHATQHQALFRVLAAARQTADPAAALDKDRVYQLVFSNSPVIKGKLEKLTSEFKKLLQTFLLVEGYLHHRTEHEHALDLAVELRRRGLEGKYKQALEKTKAIAAAEETESLDSYFFQYQVALETHEWNSTYNRAKGDLSIPDVLSSLDRYYYAQRLERLNLLLLQQKITILPADALASAQEEWAIPSTLLSEGSLIPIAWQIHAILKAAVPTIQDFEILLGTLKAHETRLSPTHLKEFYAYLRNICTLLIDAGHIELRPILFRIQTDNLSRGYFYYEGKIPSNAALNITRIALGVREIEWANAFVEGHKGLIIGENETLDFYRMNKALCLFVENKYDAALEIIPFGSSYSFYHLMARVLELKIYFELGSDLLPYKIDAFKMFISRAGDKMLSKDQHQLYTNFINFVRQLSLSPKTMDNTRSEQLIRRINAKKLVAERAWLLEKARDFREWWF